MTNEDVGVVGAVLSPPLLQCVEVAPLIASFPVDLGHNVVHQIVFYPVHDVGVEHVVVGNASSGFGPTWVIFLVSPNAKGAYAELHPRLHRFYGVGYGTYYGCHIAASPVVA